MRPFAFVLAVSMIGACGGSAFTTAASDGGADAGSGSGTDASSQGSDGSSGGGDASRGDGGGGGSSDGSANDAGPPCPDVSGTYAISSVQGGGCADLNENARQCIRMTVQGCGIAFVSPATSVSTSAINGITPIQPDASFGNATLREGTVSRSGCTGTWIAASSTMTVDCGGMASTQSCVVVLTRSGPPSCN